MKTKNPWLWVFVFVWAIIFSVQQSNSMAQQTQINQPEKKFAIQSMMVEKNSPTHIQPSKTNAIAAAQGTTSVQPSKDEALAAVQAELTAAPLAQSASSCSLCFTCGGDWPVFSGAIPTRAGAKPLEREDSCVGSLIPRVDTLPYLCCKNGQ